MFGKEVRVAESHRDDPGWSWCWHTQPECWGLGTVWCVQYCLTSQVICPPQGVACRQLFASLGWEEGGTYMLLSLLLHIPKASFWLPGMAVEDCPATCTCSHSEALSLPSPPLGRRSMHACHINRGSLLPLRPSLPAWNRRSVCPGAVGTEAEPGSSSQAQPLPWTRLVCSAQMGQYPGL